MPILALSQVTKRYGAIVVADAVDLAVEEGEALGIIGPNGAGKTSLFNLVAVLHGPAVRATADNTRRGLCARPRQSVRRARADRWRR